MDIKSILKSLKTNESTISMMLGAVVVIVAGYLAVNYFRGLPTGIGGRIGNSSQTAVDLQEESDQLSVDSHMVAAGESLWQISEDYYGTGYEWQKIAAANNLDNPSSIEEGQELVLPQATDEADLIAVNDQDESSEQNNQVLAQETTESEQQDQNMQQETARKEDSDNTYTVKAGDSLWNIAEQVYGDGYRWTDIAQENNLVNPNIIHRGNVLVLPQ